MKIFLFFLVFFSAILCSRLPARWIFMRFVVFATSVLTAIAAYARTGSVDYALLWWSVSMIALCGFILVVLKTVKNHEESQPPYYRYF